MEKFLRFCELFMKTYGTNVFVIKDTQHFISYHCVRIDGNLYFQPELNLLKKATEEFLKNYASMSSSELKIFLRNEYGFGISQKEVSDFLNNNYSHFEIEFEKGSHGHTYKRYINPVPLVKTTVSNSVAPCKILKFDCDGLPATFVEDGKKVYVPDDSIIHTFCDELFQQNGYVTARDLKISLRQSDFYATQYGCEKWLTDNCGEFDRDFEITTHNSANGDSFKKYEISTEEVKDLSDVEEAIYASIRTDDLKKWPEACEEVKQEIATEIIQANGNITARDLKNKIRERGLYGAQKECEKWLDERFNNKFNNVEDKGNYKIYSAKDNNSDLIKNEVKNIIQEAVSLFTSLMNKIRG